MAHRRNTAGYLTALLVCISTPAAAADPDPWFGRDKALHFSVSAGLSIAGYASSALLFDGYGMRAASGASVALSAGVAKEIYDATGAGSASWKDLAWDAAGTLVGVGLALAVDLLIRGQEPAKATSQATPALLRLSF